jgi:hypothetical protein
MGVAVTDIDAACRDRKRPTAPIQTRFQRLDLPVQGKVLAALVAAVDPSRGPLPRLKSRIVSKASRPCVNDTT